MTAVLLGMVVLLGLTGAGLLVVGWRGRRIDDHPICRRCGFDLVGLAAPIRCPECGRDLAGKRAIRTGTRQRRRGTLAIGAILTLIALAGGGVIGWGAAAAFNWNTIKPAWMLISEGRGASQQTAAPALKELASRIGTNTLDEGRTTELIGEALTRQGDPNATWFVEWGDIIEAGIGRKLLSPDQLLQYVKAGAVITPTVRARTRLGEKTGMQVHLRTGRVGSTFSRTLAVDLVGATVDGVAVPPGEAVGARMAISPGGRSTIAFAQELGAATGEHTLDLRWRIGEIQGFQDQTPPDPSWEVAFQSAFTVVPAGEPLVEMITDPVKGQYMREAIKVRRAEAVAAGGGATLTFEFLVSNAPVVLSVSVFARSGGVETRIGSITVDQVGGGQHATVATGSVPGLRADRIDLVLRPSEEAAIAHPGVTAIWGEEIVIRDVELKWASDERPAAPQP